jgi:hypothetical protein
VPWLVETQPEGFVEIGPELAAENLHSWQTGRVPICVTYHGPPDLGAVAERVRVES